MYDNLQPTFDLKANLMHQTKVRHAISVDRYGSITAASKRLNVNPSSISRSVSDLEAEIGFRLFDRRARDMVATEEGREFIDQARRIISDYDELLQNAKRAKDARKALIRIGVAPALTQGLINKAIVHLIESDPNLRVHLIAASVDQTMRLLLRGDIDVMIGPMSIVSSETEFSCTPIGCLRPKLFVRKGHPLADKETVNRQDIEDYPLISSEQISERIMNSEKDFSPLRTDTSRNLHLVEYFPIVRDIVRRTNSIGVVGHEYAGSAHFLANFAQLPIKFFERIDYCLAIRRRSQPSSAIRAFEQAVFRYPPFSVEEEHL